MIKSVLLASLLLLPSQVVAEQGGSSNPLESLIMMKQKLLLEHMAGDGETAMQRAIQRDLDRGKQSQNQPQEPPRITWEFSGSNRSIQAFEAQYQAPEGCDNWKDNAHMVECSNHKIRSRREFLEGKGSE